MYIFAIVFIVTIIGMCLGWILESSIEGYTYGDLGIVLGAWIGSAIGGEAAYRSRLFAAKGGRVIWVAPMFACFIFGGLGALSDLPRLLIVPLAACGAGFGALFARYCLHFFDPDPPEALFSQSIQGVNEDTGEE